MINYPVIIKFFQISVSLTFCVHLFFSSSLTFLLWKMATVSLDPWSLSSQGRKHRKVNRLWLLKGNFTLTTEPFWHQMCVFSTPSRSDTNNPALAQTPQGKGTVLWDCSHFRFQSQEWEDPQASYDFCRTWLQMGVLTTPSSGSVIGYSDSQNSGEDFT